LAKEAKVPLKIKAPKIKIIEDQKIEMVDVAMTFSLSVSEL
jgi:hypothetical protein